LVFLVFFWNPPPQKHEPVPVWTQIKRLDPLGTFFFLPGVVCLLLALQWGGSTYPWPDWRIILLFALFGVLILAFAAVQITMPKTATIPPKVITQRSIFAGTMFTFFLAGSMLVMVYFVPIWCKSSCSPLVCAIVLTASQSKRQRASTLSNQASIPFLSF
jgi:hypothetical protein